MHIKYKKTIATIAVIIIITLVCLVIILYKFNIFEYFYERTILANNPTVFFSCDRFGEEDQLYKILNEETSEKVIALKNYLSENNGYIYIEAVGNRCPNKYQFVVAFGSDKQRVEIEKILKDQTLEGIPVFLRNV